jgi:hypothetical protein
MKGKVVEEFGVCSVEVHYAKHLTLKTARAESVQHLTIVNKFSRTAGFVR